MVVVLSPARRFRSHADMELPPTRPVHSAKTQQLVALLQQYNPWELETLLRTTPALALDAWTWFQQWDSETPGTPALLAYDGLVYRHLRRTQLGEGQLKFAQHHLYIISALYGVLRPLDAILPYRLELISRIRVNGENLHRFWGDICHTAVFERGQLVLNLCSAEYSRTLTPFLRPGDRMLSCDFLTQSGGRIRCITPRAKAARGEMARFVLRGELTDPRALQTFSWDGFAFAPSLSSQDRYVFLQQA